MKKFCGVKKTYEKCAVCVHAHTKLPCNPCQYLEKPDQLKTVTYYDFFCFHDKQYAIDLDKLKETYKQFQAVLHPDKFTQALANDLQESSNVVSSFCSNAYATLSNDILRAQYLLKIAYNVNSLEEGSLE